MNLIRWKPLPNLIKERHHLDRFCKEVVHPLHQKHGLRFLHGIGRQCDNGHIIVIRIHSSYDMCGLYAVHLRHHMVHKHQVIMLCRNHVDCFRTGIGLLHFHVQGCKKTNRNCQVHFIVIHHQNLCFRRLKVNHHYLILTVQRMYILMIKQPN